MASRTPRSIAWDSGGRPQGSSKVVSPRTLYSRPWCIWAPRRSTSGCVAFPSSPVSAAPSGAHSQPRRPTAPGRSTWIERWVELKGNSTVVTMTFLVFALWFTGKRRFNLLGVDIDLQRNLSKSLFRISEIFSISLLRERADLLWFIGPRTRVGGLFVLFLHRFALWLDSNRKPRFSVRFLCPLIFIQRNIWWFSRLLSLK